MTEASRPTGLGPSGKRLWSHVTDDFDLDEHDLQLLTQACRTSDLIEQLDAAVRRDGPLVASPQGMKAHPAAVEVRQQRITFARLMAVLRLPAGLEGDEQSTARQPRRVGARGTYGLRGVV